MRDGWTAWELIADFKRTDRAQRNLAAQANSSGSIRFSAMRGGGDPPPPTPLRQPRGGVVPSPYAISATNPRRHQPAAARPHLRRRLPLLPRNFPHHAALVTRAPSAAPLFRRSRFRTSCRARPGPNRKRSPSRYDHRLRISRRRSGHASAPAATPGRHLCRPGPARRFPPARRGLCLDQRQPRLPLAAYSEVVNSGNLRPVVLRRYDEGPALHRNDTAIPNLANCLPCVSS
jgi:hypothetical protein